MGGKSALWRQFWRITLNQNKMKLSEWRVSQFSSFFFSKFAGFGENTFDGIF